MTHRADQPGNNYHATRCLKCSALTVQLRRRPGRTVRFRNMTALPVPDDFPIPTCRRCCAEYIDLDTAALLDVALVEAYVSELRRRVRIAIDRIIEHISQRRLELLLGLSQGYLSRLRAGSGRPSAPLVALLMFLALDPPARLAELDRFASEPIPES